MKITYLDAGTREVIDIVDDPALVPALIKSDDFAASLDATVIKKTPADSDDEWTVELEIPDNVRLAHTPHPGDKVRFTAKFGYHDEELSGVFLFKRGRSYIVLDDYGGEWKFPSIWQMKKV